MALSTYAELKTSLASWLRRSDVASTSADFITLAEAQLNRVLRVRPMVARATATLSAEYAAAPGDFIAPISFVLESNPQIVLEYVSPERIAELEAMEVTTCQDRPQWWSIVGGEFRLYPVPTTPYVGELTYWQKIPALSDSNPSNWLLASHPDVYLYGALMQSAPYLKNDARIGTWSGLYANAVNDVRDAYRIANTTTLRMDDMPTVHRRFDFARGY